MDAIDGTASFVAGEPEWGTLIALAEGDDVCTASARTTVPELDWHSALAPRHPDTQARQAAHTAT